MKSKLPILLYHDLESPDYPSEKTNPAAKDTVVDLLNFDAQMRWIHDNGYQTLSIKEYYQFRSKSKPIPPKKIILTFDDGHYSSYHLAFPSLQKYGFKATFFVITDRVDQRHHLAGNQINEMHDSGMEIGSHGLSHQYLPLMEYGEIERELFQSKKILESIIKKPVDYFAFPGGHYTRRVLRILSGCGYKGACSCLQGLNHFKTNPYLLRRIEIRRRFSVDEFKRVFHPTQIAYYQIIDLWKRLTSFIQSASFSIATSVKIIISELQNWTA